MTVLVTGAAGQAGKAVIKALIKKRMEVCAMVHRESQTEQMSEMGIGKTVVGDMLNLDDLRKAFEGADAIYFICSAGNPDEYRMGQLAIELSKEMKLKHFIYHSVLHSLLREMPHHKQKNQVENALVNSGLAYTIIQPAVILLWGMPGHLLLCSEENPTHCRSILNRKSVEKDYIGFGKAGV